MTQLKSKNRIVKILVIVAVFLIAVDILLSGINTVPFIYRNTTVSFLTPDLTWNSKPSDVILKYGLPEDISEANDITGERTFKFKFIYDEKEISLSADNRSALNSELHRYYFTIDCKTPEEANKYFDKCHKNIMDSYKNDPDFKFNGTETETDYQFTDGSPCSYASTYEDDEEKILIMDDDGNEIPLEEAENVIEIKTKVNTYDTFDTVGVSYSLDLSESDSCVTLCAEIMY